MSGEPFTLRHAWLIANALESIPDGTELIDVAPCVRRTLQLASAPEEVCDLGEALARFSVQASGRASGR